MKNVGFIFMITAERKPAKKTIMTATLLCPVNEFKISVLVNAGSYTSQSITSILQIQTVQLFESKRGL